MTAVTINGNAYSDDGSESRDMQGFGYRSWLLPMLADTMTRVSDADNSAAAASDSESNAAASATAAQNYAAALSGTSTTSTTIGTGSKALTTQANKQFADGQWVMLVRSADVNAWMFGQITNYNSGTGSITVNVSVSNGSGTSADWVIVLAGARGARGPDGAGLPSFTGSDAAKLLAVNPSGTDTEWVEASFSNVQIITSTDTFTPAAGREVYFVIAVAAGGGGYNSEGYSGWGGDTVIGFMSISSAQTVTIGAGGTGGASPTAGGDTSIGSLLVAKGGASALTASPATGGTTPTGCFRIQGGRSVGGPAGCTGSTFLSPRVETNVSVTLPQDGHGGASTSSSYTQRNGGAGVVIIMW